MSVDCIRIGAVRLCLALMLALIVVPGYVVAPVLFAKAGSTTLAGMLAGEVFHVANLGLIFLAGAVMVFWLRMRASGVSIGRLRWLLLATVFLFAVINEFGLAPAMAELKLQMAAAAGSIDAAAEDDPLRRHFGMLHGISATLHLVEAIAATLLVALGGRAASHRKNGAAGRPVGDHS